MMTVMNAHELERIVAAQWAEHRMRDPGVGAEALRADAVACATIARRSSSERSIYRYLISVLR
jgi:hypothetical protein